MIFWIKSEHISRKIKIIKIRKLFFHRYIEIDFVHSESFGTKNIWPLLVIYGDILVIFLRILSTKSIISPEKKKSQ